MFSDWCIWIGVILPVAILALLCLVVGILMGHFYMTKLADDLCAEIRNQCEQAEHFKGLWLQTNNELEAAKLRLEELTKLLAEERKKVVPETIIQNAIEHAHMAGQIDAGCESPSYSNALSWYKHKGEAMFDAAPQPEDKP